jgi:cyclophilin family peptidyl-prolyl cis-trans isomerase
MSVEKCRLIKVHIMIRKNWFCVLLASAVWVCGCAETAKTPKTETKIIPTSNIVKLQTSMGDIVIELNRQAAPVAVQNFLGYVEAGFYDGTIFHRIMQGFMIQGGGFTNQMVEKKTRKPIINEAKNGLSNMRGTIAMARTSDPDSATSQFFINHSDNEFLNYIDESKAGYAVFGKVIEGMDVVDTIASVKTTTVKITRNGRDASMENVPVEPIIIQSAKVVPE